MVLVTLGLESLYAWLATMAGTRAQWGKFFCKKGILRSWREGVSASDTGVMLFTLCLVRGVFFVLEHHFGDSVWNKADPNSQKQSTGVNKFLRSVLVDGDARLRAFTYAAIVLNLLMVSQIAASFGDMGDE